MGKIKKPTCTRLIMEVLRGCDDFRTKHMLMKETGCSLNQTSAALHGLRNRRAVDVIVQPDGVGWWYALPPENDTRNRVIDDIQSEIHRKRKSKPKEVK